MTKKEMVSAINKMTDELGIPPIKFSSDRDLKAFSRGAPLKVRELRALPNDAVVWVWYREDGADHDRIDEAMRISKNPEWDYWSLGDGSSFGADFRPTGEWAPTLGDFGTAGPEADCIDESGGEATMRLYHAVPVQPRARPKKKGKSRG